MVVNPGDGDLIAAVSDHIERSVGPIHMVFHEIVSDRLHIDVYHVAPDATRPFHTLVTSGMSEAAMNTPDEVGEFRFAELSILLAPTWDLRQESFEDENHYWPIRLLKTLARYPGENDTWLGYGHSVATANPPTPFAPGTELSACVLLAPLSLGEPFFTLTRPDGATTHFWTVVPLYADELELKVQKGTDALLDAFDRAGVDDVVHPTRPRARVRKTFGIF